MNYPAEGSESPNFKEVAENTATERLQQLLPRRRMNDDANEMAAMMAAVQMGEDPYNVTGVSSSKKKKKKKRKSNEGAY